jgi:hypothetical protein
MLFIRGRVERRASKPKFRKYTGQQHAILRFSILVTPREEPTTVRGESVEYNIMSMFL